jgi:hypothetical protein
MSAPRKSPGMKATFGKTTAPGTKPLVKATAPGAKPVPAKKAETTVAKPQKPVSSASTMAKAYATYCSIIGSAEKKDQMSLAVALLMARKIDPNFDPVAFEAAMKMAESLVSDTSSSDNSRKGGSGPSKKPYVRKPYVKEPFDKKPSTVLSEEPTPEKPVTEEPAPASDSEPEKKLYLYILLDHLPDRDYLREILQAILEELKTSNSPNKINLFLNAIFVAAREISESVNDSLSLRVVCNLLVSLFRQDKIPKISSDDDAAQCREWKQHMLTKLCDRSIELAKLLQLVLDLATLRKNQYGCNLSYAGFLPPIIKNVEGNNSLVDLWTKTKHDFCPHTLGLGPLTEKIMSVLIELSELFELPTHTQDGSEIPNFQRYSMLARKLLLLLADKKILPSAIYRLLNQLVAVVGGGKSTEVTFSSLAVNYFRELDPTTCYNLLFWCLITLSGNGKIRARLTDKSEMYHQNVRKACLTILGILTNNPEPGNPSSSCFVRAALRKHRTPTDSSVKIIIEDDPRTLFLWNGECVQATKCNKCTWHKPDPKKFDLGSSSDSIVSDSSESDRLISAHDPTDDDSDDISAPVADRRAKKRSAPVTDQRTEKRSMRDSSSAGRQPKALRRQRVSKAEGGSGTPSVGSPKTGCQKVDNSSSQPVPDVDELLALLSDTTVDPRGNSSDCSDEDVCRILDFK